MKHQISSGLSLAAAFALAVGLSAQQTPAPKAGALAHPQSVKLTGCVERSTTAVAGTPTATTSAPGEAMYLLTRAIITTGAPATATTAPAGAQPAAPPIGHDGAVSRPVVGTTAGTITPMTYRLDADAATVAPHVGRRVEVSGEIVENVAPAVATPTPSVGGPAGSTVPTLTASITSPDARHEAGTMPRLRVIEIKAIAATCS